LAERFLLNTWDVTALNQSLLCKDTHTRVNGGAFRVSDAPGLGVMPEETRLGSPVHSFPA
jgi:hypothetical protein